jgi:nucleoside-diphosphate-sugar epimerase
VNNIPPYVKPSLLKSDLAKNGVTWRSGTFLVLGASGPIGQWMVGSFLSLLASEDSQSQIVLVGRNPQRLRTLFEPISVSQRVIFADSVILDDVVKKYRPDFVWHFSAFTKPPTNGSVVPTYAADTLLTLRLLNALTSIGKRATFLYTSSGAVYGRGQISMPPPSEDDVDGLNLKSGMLTYERAKLMSEQLLLDADRDGVIEARIARLYSFVGPLIPLDQHFAIGNFLYDALHGRSISLHSTGVDFRSWMHFRDLVRALLVFQVTSSVQVVNIGSSEIMQIHQAAALVAEIAATSVTLREDALDTRPSYYVPNLDRFNSILKIGDQLTLRDSIVDTLTWLKVNR